MVEFKCNAGEILLVSDSSIFINLMEQLDGNAQFSANLLSFLTHRFPAQQVKWIDSSSKLLGAYVSPQTQLQKWVSQAEQLVKQWQTWFEKSNFIFNLDLFLTALMVVLLSVLALVLLVRTSKIKLSWSQTSTRNKN